MAESPRRSLVAEFHHEPTMLAAVRRLRDASIPIDDVYSPYPIHALDELLSVRRTRLPWVTLVAGAFGTLSAMGFQFYAAVIDWPINVGGKPANSALAFMPITFELTVLLGGLATAGAFLLRSRLFPGARPRRRLAGVTDDRFVVVVAADDAADEAEARRLLSVAGAADVRSEELS